MLTEEYAEYFTRYGQAYKDCMDQLGPTPSFDAAMIERLGRGTDADVRQRTAQRDSSLARSLDSQDS